MAGVCCKYFTVSLVPVAALLLALLFACGILSLPIIYSELSNRYEYGLVIDAGSSHTSVYLYRLRMREPLTGEVAEIDHSGVNTSLSSFENDTSGAYGVVTKLLQRANNSLGSIDLPSDMYNTTRVYLGATAGMRLLRRKNETAAHDILESAKSAILSSGFKHKSAIIISGTEEAASGWLTANYLMGNSEKGLVGSLDMGGASTEIAFSVDPKAPKSRYHVTDRLVGKEEHLYARSYLCYGHNEALGRFLAHLVSENTSKTVNVSNPCLPKNFVANHTVAKIYTSCVTEADGVDVFGFALAPPAHLNASSNISFLGTGDTEKCTNVTEQVFDFYACNTSGACNNESQYEVPPINGTFVGFSGFHYNAKGLKYEGLVFNRNSVPTPMNLAEDYCRNSTVSSVNASMGDLCFFGVFMAYVFEEGFGMKESSPNNWTLVFKDLENGQSFGWAMGYFMNKTYSFVDHPTHLMVPFTAVDMVVGMIILTILCAIFVIFFFLTFYACKKVLKTHSGYQSIS